MTAERNDNELVLRAQVPGIQPDEVTVEVKDGVLTVSGEHREEHEEDKDGYTRRESRRGSFSRSVTLPPEVDPDRVKTSVEDGTVVVTLAAPEDE
ncbi:MAG: Hsp20/alpha crystallin family protein [Solirubrobacterales bacterium]